MEFRADAGLLEHGKADVFLLGSWQSRAELLPWACAHAQWGLHVGLSQSWHRARTALVFNAGNQLLANRSRQCWKSTNCSSR